MNDIKHLLDVHNPQTIHDLGVIKFQTIWSIGYTSEKSLSTEVRRAYVRTYVRLRTDGAQIIAPPNPSGWGLTFYETVEEGGCIIKGGGQQTAKVASAGNRTRAARVAGEHSTTEPPMLPYKYREEIEIDPSLITSIKL